MVTTKKVIVIYDPGNRRQSLAVGKNSKPVTWDASIYRPGTTLPHRDIPNTAFIDIKLADTVETFVVGDGAKSQPNYLPVHKSDITPGYGKLENAKLFLLGMLSPQIAGQLTKSDVFEISELWICHPEPTEDIIEKLHEVLVGTHEYICNGVKYTCKIPASAIHVYPEGVPGYYYCVQQKLFVPPTGNEVVCLVDVGGLTAIGQGFNQYGPLPESRFVLNRGGSAELARRIADAMKAAKRLKGKPNLDLILDGLAIAVNREGEKRYPYGANQFFDDLVPPAKQSWCVDLIGDYTETFSQFMDQRIATVFIGGGSYHLTPIIKQLSEFNYILAPDPEIANIEGLRILSQGLLDDSGIQTPAPITL